jgi:lysine 2,3-aminomutase
MQKELGKKRSLDDVVAKYSVKTTSYLDDMMNNEAIERQYLPDIRELDTLPSENIDPIGDKAHEPVKGIVHRYPDRVLLKPHHACAVYCRFCFRRDMVGRNGEVLSVEELNYALDYIRRTPEIWEVILTGGDPLALSDRRLTEILQSLEAIEHVKVIRIHTRVPVADPNRITTELCDIFKRCQKPIYISIHCNHADELQTQAIHAIEALGASGSVLVSQTVLLKGINDNVAILESLFRELVASGVKPYYLHHPDKARGTSHFRLSLERGMQIYSSLRGRLSGIAIPQYMLDIPGGHGKVEVMSAIQKINTGRYQVIAPNGVTHIYTDD